MLGYRDGATVALLVALRRPDLVRRLVFTAGVCYKTFSHVRGTSETLMQVRSPGLTAHCQPTTAPRIGNKSPSRIEQVSARLLAQVRKSYRGLPERLPGGQPRAG